MSNEQYIEEILYEVYQQGKSEELFKVLDLLKQENPRTSTFQLIEEAYYQLTK